jgi:hypothetical protein
MAVLWSVTAHIDWIAILGDISSAMLEAMILFVMHDVES